MISGNHQTVNSDIQWKFTNARFGERQFQWNWSMSRTTSDLAEHVEEEPVAHLALLDDGVDDLSLDQPEADVEKVGAYARTQDDDGAVEDYQRRQRAQNQKPGTRRVRKF